ncbi:MAG: ABC transporter ATP-binding protein [Candidatus Tectomicrobia bacterium RIFCSPLOWO2_02_FULL_70_19]|nr:MAG: ABC transporter ATP-binding protein [Candidatus Tectomicrobia bacterium RIFCSPLOWO2_02_FULL_70_19]
MSETVLELSGVTKRFSGAAEDAVSRASFFLLKGQVFSILGPSGCGKTTTLRLIAGLDRPDEGEIVLAGRSVAGGRRWVPPEKRGVGMVFQDHALFPHKTVAQNVAFGLQHLSRQESRARVREALAQVNLTGLDGRYPHQLSGGQQQRVALARALAPRPEVLLLDEPFSSLDARLRNQVRDEVVAILRRSGQTTLIVSHDERDALAVSDRIIVMNRGRIEQIGTPREVYQFPATEYVARFVGQTNILPGIILEAGYDEVMTSIGPVPCLSMRGLDFGTDAFISIRPESFEIGPEGPFHARVAQIAYGGQYITLVVELLLEPGRGQRLTLHAHPNLRVDLGEEIRFRVIPDFVTVIEDSNGG